MNELPKNHYNVGKNNPMFGKNNKELICQES